METTTKIPFKSLSDIEESGYFPIVELEQSTKSIRCQVWWVDVDKFDGELKLAVQEDHRAIWADVPKMVHPIDNINDNGTGQITFIYDPSSGIKVALYIDPGSATKGTINLILIEND